MSPSDYRTHSRKLMARGLAWNTVYQICQSGVGFAAMLILVRLIPPAEYGKVGVAIGILSLINAMSCSVFMGHALQLPDDVEPDWSLHWGAGFYIQVALTIVCNVVASSFWFISGYRPVAPLLHLASVGLMLSWPTHLAIVMLRRDMDFKRLRILSTVGMVIASSVTLAIALLGGNGAFAIVLGSNVLLGVPLAIDLLFLRRWKPVPGWWRWPDWKAYSASLRFGLQQSASGALHATRSALESIVLPATLGFSAIGLIGRAIALYNTTIGRVENTAVETIYPLLPRFAAHPGEYPRKASLFVGLVLLIAVPGSIFIGLEGPRLSRLVYGAKWAAADPLILPASVGCMGVAIFGGGLAILLAANRLRTCLLLEVLSAALAVPAVAFSLLRFGMTAYVWVMAAAQLAAGLVAFRQASRFLERRGLRSVLLPPVLSTAAAVTVLLAVHGIRAPLEPTVRLLCETAAFWITLAAVLRQAFPDSLSRVLSRMPGGASMIRWMRLGSFDV